MDLNKRVINYLKKDQFNQAKIEIINKTKNIDNSLINEKPITYLNFVNKLNTLIYYLTEETLTETPLTKLTELKTNYLKKLDETAYNINSVITELKEPYNKFFNQRIMKDLLTEKQEGPKLMKERYLPPGIGENIDSEAIKNTVNHYLQNFQEVNDIKEEFMEYLKKLETTEEETRKVINKILKDESIKRNDLIKLEELIIKEQLNQLIPVKNKEVEKFNNKIKKITEKISKTNNNSIKEKISRAFNNDFSYAYESLAEEDGITNKKTSYGFASCYIIQELEDYFQELTNQEQTINKPITRSPRRSANIIESAFKPLIKELITTKTNNYPLFLSDNIYSNINSRIDELKDLINDSWTKVTTRKGRTELNGEFNWENLNQKENKYEIINKELLNSLKGFLNNISELYLIKPKGSHLWLEYKMKQGLLNNLGLNDFLISKLIEVTKEKIRIEELTKYEEAINELNKKYYDNFITNIKIGDESLEDILKKKTSAEYIKLLIKDEVKKEEVIPSLINEIRKQEKNLTDYINNLLADKKTKNNPPPGFNPPKDSLTTNEEKKNIKEMLNELISNKEKSELIKRVNNNLASLKNIIETEFKGSINQFNINKLAQNEDFKKIDKIIQNKLTSHDIINDLIEQYKEVEKSFESVKDFEEKENEMPLIIKELIEEYQVNKILMKELTEDKILQSKDEIIERVLYNKYNKINQINNLTKTTKLSLEQKIEDEYTEVRNSLVNESIKELYPGLDSELITYGLKIIKDQRGKKSKFNRQEIINKIVEINLALGKVFKNEIISNPQNNTKLPAEVINNLTTAHELLGSNSLNNLLQNYIQVISEAERKKNNKRLKNNTRLIIPKELENTLYYNIINGLGNVFNHYKQKFVNKINDLVLASEMDEIPKPEEMDGIIEGNYTLLTLDLSQDEFMEGLINNELSNYLKNLIKDSLIKKEEILNNKKKIKENIKKHNEIIKKQSIIKESINNTSDNLKEISKQKGLDYQELIRAKKKITNIINSISKRELTISQRINEITKQYNVTNNFVTEQIKNMGMNELNQKSTDLIKLSEIVLNKSYEVLNSLKNIEELYKGQENKVNKLKEENEKELTDYLTKLEQEFIDLREQIITNLSEEEIKTKTIKLSKLKEKELETIINEGTNLEDKIKTINTRQVKGLITIFNKETLNKNEEENIDQSLNELKAFYKNYQESKIKKVIYKLLRENTDKKIDKINVEGFLKNIGYKRLINTTRKRFFKKVTDTEIINEDKKATYVKQENLVNDLHKRIINNKTNSYKKKIEELTNYIKKIEQKLNLETYNLKELELEDDLKQEVTEEVLNKSKKQLIKILNNFRVPFNKTITGDNLLEDIITSKELLKSNKEINNLILSKFNKNLKEWYETIKKYQRIEQETSMEKKIDENVNKTEIKRDFKNTLKELKTKKKLETITNFVKKHPQYNTHNISELIGQTENQLKTINEINNLSKNKKQELTKINIDTLNNEFSENITKIDRIAKVTNNLIISLNELEQSNPTTLTPPPSNLKAPPTVNQTTSTITEEEIANNLKKKLETILNS